jgi:hypothetical protein
VNNIRVFKLFFHVGGEFPVIKIVGFRRIYYKFKWLLSPGATSPVLNSGRFIEPADTLAIDDDALVFRKPRFYKRARYSNKLKPISAAKKIRKASYTRRILPLLGGNWVESQMRRLFFVETFSNLGYYSFSYSDQDQAPAAEEFFDGESPDADERAIINAESHTGDAGGGGYRTFDEVSTIDATIQSFSAFNEGLIINVIF